jgi:hypothetical protein
LRDLRVHARSVAPLPSARAGDVAIAGLGVARVVFCST